MLLICSNKLGTVLKQFFFKRNDNHVILYFIKFINEIIFYLFYYVFFLCRWFEGYSKIITYNWEYVKDID